MRKLIEKVPWLYVYVKVKLHLRTNAPQQASLWCYMGGQAPQMCNLCRCVCTAFTYRVTPELDLPLPDL